MKKKTFIFVMVIFLIFSKGAFAVSCPTPPKPKLNMSMTKTRTKFNFSKSLETLTKENITDSSKFAGWINEGIMSTKFPNYKISAKVGGVSYEGLGKACYWIEEINFDWVLEPTIFIAKEYKRGSCKYNTIIAHERQHVEIDIAILKKYKNIIKKNLRKQVESPISTGLTRLNNNINLLNLVEKKLNPVIEAMVRERKKRQSGIDTVAEYTRLANKCRKR